MDQVGGLSLINSSDAIVASYDMHVQGASAGLVIVAHFEIPAAAVDSVRLYWVNPNASPTHQLVPSDMYTVTFDSARQ